MGLRKVFGGIAALEKLARLYAKKYDTSKMRLDHTDRHTYTFSNGKSARVDGRATFVKISWHRRKGVTRLLRFQALKKMVGRDLPWEWPGRHSNNLEDLDTLESVFQPNLTSAQ